MKKEKKEGLVGFFVRLGFVSFIHLTLIYTALQKKILNDVQIHNSIQLSYIKLY